MSKYDAVYLVVDNQAINQIRVESCKRRNRDTFSGSLAALDLSLPEVFSIYVLPLCLWCEFVIVTPISYITASGIKKKKKKKSQNIFR